MGDPLLQACFQIDEADNVCTALSPLKPGTVKLNGSRSQTSVEVLEEVVQGHKIAIKPIAAGEPIIKYGVTIGVATRDIRPGEWVHLHNCKSLYDERSSTLDVNSGAPTDIRYE